MENNKVYCQNCDKFVVPLSREMQIDEDDITYQDVCPECGELLNED